MVRVLQRVPHAADDITQALDFHQPEWEKKKKSALNTAVFFSLSQSKSVTFAR